MYPRGAVRSSGLDITLLGVIFAIIGFYGSRLGEMVGTMPHIIRFFDVPPDRQTPGVMPQDQALILLNDPATAASAPISNPIPALPIGDLPTVVMYVGIVLIFAGPIWSWRNR